MKISFINNNKSLLFCQEKKFWRNHLFCVIRTMQRIDQTPFSAPTVCKLTAKRASN
jgi:hypothetical protein